MAKSKMTKTRNRDKKEELSLVVIKPKQTSLLVIPSREIIAKSINKIKIAIISTFIIVYIILILIIATSIFYVSNLNSGKIQNGIFVNGINISNLTKEQANVYLNSNFNEKIPEYLNLRYKNNIYKITLSDLSIHYDIEKTVEEAYSIGRTKNVVNDLWDYLRVINDSKNIDLEISYNTEVLQQFINEIYDQLPDKVKEYTYIIKDNLLIINKGKAGVELDEEKLKQLILSNIKSCNFEEELEIPVIDVIPIDIDIQKIHNEIYKLSQDAYFTENPITIYEEIIGVDFNIEEAVDIINKDKNAESYKIPLKFEKPNICIEDLNVFPDILSTFNTNYVNNYNRTINLILAANKINGTVLKPNEEFSFNKIVGERTVQAGYKNAAIFVNGEVEDGLAGGICQISSTLYNAVIGADLDVIERHNHSMITSYLPGGKDATVSWGRYDFKFINNREFPIKIEMIVENGKVTANIYGIKKDYEYDIKIESFYLGREGIYNSYDAFKVYRKDGIEVNRKFLSKDLYK